jgi:hypothetical protein
MPSYRIYWLTSDDRIRAGDYIDCENDGVALAQAQKMRGQSPAVEIWEGKRHVATLRAEQPIDELRF